MKLDAVSKIASVKTSDNKSNLLRYCASEMVRLHGADSIANVGRELNALVDAAKAPLEEVKSSIAKISKGIQLITTCLEKNLSKEVDEVGEEVGEEVGDAAVSKTTKKSTKSTKDQDINSTSVDRCFTNFLTYAEGVRDGLSQRFKSTEEEGQRVVKLFAEDSKKVSSAEVYGKLVESVKLFERAHDNNKRAVEQRRKAESRAAKMTQAAAEKEAKKEGGMFEAHSMFQSGGANDIVARVRQRNMIRQKSNTNTNDPEDDDDESFASDNEDDNQGRPPPPPKPPPSLVNRFSH
jgi:hypothetical protein